jgi:hypothetical protein
MGIRPAGLSYLMMNRLGEKHRKAMTMPFTMAGKRKSEVASLKPTTTQRKKADKLASHVKFWISIGTTSNMPAPTPMTRPTAIHLFIFPSFLSIYWLS